MKRIFLKSTFVLLAFGSMCWFGVAFAKPLFNLTTLNSTIVIAPGNVLTPVLFTVTNTSGVPLSNISFDANYLPVHFSTITLNTMATTCVGGSTLANGASCVLAVNIQAGTKAGQDVFSPRVCAFGGQICSGVSCQSTTPPNSGSGIQVAVTSNATIPPALKYLYAQETFNALVNLCNLNAAGSLTSCAPTGSNFPQPEELILTAKHAYVINSAGGTGGAGGITTCNLTQSNGTLSGCTFQDSTVVTGIANPEGMAMDPAQKFLFIANTFGNNVIRCNIDQTTGLVTGCTTVATPGATTSGPTAVRFNPAGNLIYFGYATFANYFITDCQFDSVTGNLSNCQNSDTNPTLFNYAAGVNFNASGTIAYISNMDNVAPNNVVVVCPVPPGGTLNSALCRGTTDPNLVNSEEVDFSSDGSLAYVANGQLSNATLAICQVDTTGAATGFVGMLYHCITTPFNFGGGLGGITVSQGI